VLENTGFAFDRADEIATTPGPDALQLTLIRGRVRAELAETYPRFVARILPERAA